jgi:hypothetical protein
MDGIPAIYLGRIVNKDNFRAFIYKTDSSKKLIESWDDFEKHMELGIWFASIDDALASLQKPKGIRNKKTIKDDFLPKESSL